MMRREDRAALPARYTTGLRKFALASLAGALCWGSAAAADYTITTRTSGNAGNFLLPQFFPQGDLEGTDTYELTVTSMFDRADVTSSIDNHWMRAEGVALNVSLRFGSKRYSLDATGTVSSQILSDTDGGGHTIKRFYNSISFDPSTTGAFATIEQYLFLGADQFVIDSVLQPATGYYADPLVKGFSFYNYDLNPDGSLTLLGDGAGRASTFEYNLAAVPEPGTWAMLGAGLAIVGFGARRRAAANA